MNGNNPVNKEIAHSLHQNITKKKNTRGRVSTEILQKTPFSLESFKFSIKKKKTLTIKRVNLSKNPKLKNSACFPEITRNHVLNVSKISENVQNPTSSESSQSEEEDEIPSEKIDSEKMRQIHKRIRKILQPKYKSKNKNKNKKKQSIPDLNLLPISPIHEKKEVINENSLPPNLNYPSALQNPNINNEYEKRETSQSNLPSQIDAKSFFEHQMQMNSQISSPLLLPNTLEQNNDLPRRIFFFQNQNNNNNNFPNNYIYQMYYEKHLENLELKKQNMLLTQMLQENSTKMFYNSANKFF